VSSSSRTLPVCPRADDPGAWDPRIDEARVRVLTANGDDLTDESDPSRKMMRQIAGAFAEYEKARLIAKRRHARDRVRAERGRCEGRKPVPSETP